MNQYKINIHAHTIFSDGANSPYTMAIEAKRLGFTALVVTDHCYAQCGIDMSQHSLSLDRMRVLKRACREARDVLPVVIGMEYGFGGEEVLIFGGGLINHILEMGRRPTLDEMAALKHQYGAAIVLCHPNSPDQWEYLRPVLDGFEHYNAGQDMFKGRSSGCLDGLPGWCNSDAHQVAGLDRAYNIVGKKITDEGDLIRYIKSGKQPTAYLKESEAT